MEHIASSLDDQAWVEEAGRRLIRYLSPLETANTPVHCCEDAVNCAVATAANGTNSVLRLPVEVLGMLMSRIVDIKDIGAFRLTCRKIGHCDGSQASLFHEATVSLHPTSTFKLSLVASNRIYNRAGVAQQSASWVKTLVFEDVRMATLPSEAQRVHRKHIKGFIDRFYDMNLANMITAAAASLSNLETIVYDAGSRRTLLSKSSGSALLSATQEVETARASAAMAGNSFNSAEAFEIALWKRRDECFAPMGSRDRFDLTRDIFCRIIDHLLRHPTPGAKPLTVKIICPLKAMFKKLAFDTRIYMFPKAFPKWPAYNRLQRLELRYTSRNMGYPNCFRDDLFVLCGSNGQDQFSNLRSLTLGGVDLTRRSYLNLNLLGKPDFRPDWPNLEMLRLENVQLRSETANFFQEQRFVLEVQNAMWLDHSFEAFEMASQLLGAKLSGTHLLEMIPGSSSVIGTRKNKRFCRFGAWVVAHHEQAAQMARIQMQSCWAKFEVVQELFVTEAEVEAYMLQGGICPLNDTNIWCFV